MDDPYSEFNPGKINLKKKKSKKHLSKQVEKEVIMNGTQNLTVGPFQYQSNTNRAELTDAQKKFLESSNKRLVETFDSKKELSYKEKLSEFNRKLDTLSEHFDIQKVSWTK